MTPAERDAERMSALTLRRMARLKAALEAEIARQNQAGMPA